MKHKVLGSVFVLAIAIGLVGVSVHSPQQAPSAPAAKPDLTRPLAAYRVHETGDVGGMEYRAANYKARVSEEGFVFGAVPERGSVWASREFNVEFGAPRVEQGSASLACGRATFVRSAFGVGQIDRGILTEEYVFENNRVEQNFRIPRALGTGELRITIPVKSDLRGPVVAHPLHADAFVEPLFAKGGLGFCDAAGATRLAYHTAVAIDAAGRKVAIEPRHENSEIVLAVPAEFLAAAKYPVVVDPWLDFLGSGSGGGISNNASNSINPALALTPGGLPLIAWSDNSAADTANPNNYDIYMVQWNGFQFNGLATSNSPGGISQNTGRSVNPSITLDAAFSPMIAWEDDTSGSVSIYVRVWPDKGQAGEGNWTELAGSASNTGISSTFPPSQHPSIGFLSGVIPGNVTTNPVTGVVTSDPPQFIPCPVVAFESIQEAGSQIYCYAFYPGQPARPADPALPAFPQGQAVVPPGWYQLGPANGQGVSSTKRFPFQSTSQTPFGAVAQYPSLVVDDQNQVVVSWQDTRNGNYEIYCSRYTTAGFADFQIQSNAALTGFNMLPAGNFKDVQNTAFMSPATSTGRVLATATPSQFPFLNHDNSGTDNFTIAWQETEAAAPPAPGTSSQIYVARSVNGGAWTGLSGSTGPGGISKTLGNAVNPAVDVNGGYIGVCWADDSNGRSSVYIRRLFLGGGTWDQVGFQGSAFPPAFLGETAPIGGISQSTNFAIQPQIKLDIFGSPTVAWADGSAATFDIRVKTFSPNGPGIGQGFGTPNPVFVTTLRQTDIDPTLPAALDIPVPGFSTGTSIFLSSRVFTETLLPPGTTLRLEIEVQPAGAGFTNSPNHQTLFVVPDDPLVTPANLAVFKFDGLPNSNYHWQARTVDQIGRQSPWIIFADVGGVSFRINTAGGGSGGNPNGPANTAVVTAGHAKSKGNCGLLGLDAIVLLGALRLIRRKRSTK